MELYLTRHGQTHENTKNIFQGPHPEGEIGTLNDLGKEQAKKLGKRLAKEKFDYIYFKKI